jgi:uracil-DNA glycosylase
VHGVLEELGAERRVILWNTVPTHPHVAGVPLSNRRPSREEVAAGGAYLDRLITVLRPGLLIGIGRIACAACTGAHYVRHPAQSGATAFRQGMRSLLG